MPTYKSNLEHVVLEVSHIYNGRSFFLISYPRLMKKNSDHVGKISSMRSLGFFIITKRLLDVIEMARLILYESRN